MLKHPPTSVIVIATLSGWIKSLSTRFQTAYTCDRFLLMSKHRASGTFQTVFTYVKFRKNDSQYFPTFPKSDFQYLKTIPANSQGWFPEVPGNSKEWFLEIPNNSKKLFLEISNNSKKWFPEISNNSKKMIPTEFCLIWTTTVFLGGRHFEFDNIRLMFVKLAHTPPLTVSSLGCFCCTKWRRVRDKNVSKYIRLA